MSKSKPTSESTGTSTSTSTDHIVLNVYGSDRVETVRNAMRAAEEHEGTETHGEAVHALAKAYTGWSAEDGRGGE